jgi:inorganic pyrophosphatase
MLAGVFKVTQIRKQIMDLTKISIGKNPPQEINVVIEVPMASDPVKYELDKDSGVLFVDRFLPTAMHYPCNYGFIPHTLSGDGDPADALVICEYPVAPGSVIAVRPVGVLIMEDESGIDEKLLTVPISKLTTYYDNINNYTDLPDVFLQRISHFFEYYKKLEKNKWVKIVGWEGKDKAVELIREAIIRASSNH